MFFSPEKELPAAALFPVLDRLGEIAPGHRVETGGELLDLEEHLERIALSFGLSIALVPLSVFWLNWLFHVPITLLSTCLVTLGLIAIPIGYLGVRKSSWGIRLGEKLKSIIVFKFSKVFNLKTSLSKLKRIIRIFPR